MAQTVKSTGKWSERLASGDRVALARAITVVENDRAEAGDVLKAVHGHTGRAQVVGVTGAPGVGKSTMLNALIAGYRKRGKSVGVVAVDPSSPLSGGAILGDRIRMSEHGGDPGVFVRSLASRGHLGGLSRAAARVVDVMDAAGRDVIIVETVGAGQSEVEIMHIAQTVLVICAPGLGDDIQAVKAGILEIAHILVVNKADMPLADRAVSQLKDALLLSHHEGWQVPVLQTTATIGEGIDALIENIAEHYVQLPAELREHSGRARMRTLIASTAGDQVRLALQAPGNEKVDALSEAVLGGELGFDEAARQAAKLVAGKK